MHRKIFLFFFFRYGVLANLTAASADLLLPDWNEILDHELYDFELDPWETRNVVSDPANEQIVAELKKKLFDGWTAAEAGTKQLL